MTFKQLAKWVCQHEGMKEQVNIAQVSEILRCLSTLPPREMLRALGWTFDVTFTKIAAWRRAERNE